MEGCNVNFNTRRKKYCEATRTQWGIDAQINMAIEEMAELIVELQKLKRERAQNIPEEIADVSNMIEQLTMMFSSEEEVNRIKQEKRERTMRKINVENTKL